MCERGRKFGAAGRIPPVHHAVGAVGHDALSIGCVERGVDRRLVGGEHRDGFAAGDIPEPRGVVIAARDQPRAVGTEGDAMNAADVARELGDLGAGLHIPKAHGLIGGGRGDRPAIRAERRIEHHVLVALKRRLRCNTA